VGNHDAALTVSPDDQAPRKPVGECGIPGGSGDGLCTASGIMGCAHNTAAGWTELSKFVDAELVGQVAHVQVFILTHSVTK